MNLTEAVARVVADQRRSYPDLTVAEAVADVRNNLVLTREAWVPGATVLNGDFADPTYEAFRLVLAASDDELAEAGN
ncbi:hypothetical protein ACWGQ5_21615 [Streptomyces sp. NPDC055722]